MAKRTMEAELTSPQLDSICLLIVAGEKVNSDLVRELDRVALVLYVNPDGIAERDVLMAAAAKAVIVGSNVKPSSAVAELAKSVGVAIQLHTGLDLARRPAGDVLVCLFDNGLAVERGGRWYVPERPNPEGPWALAEPRDPVGKPAPPLGVPPRVAFHDVDIPQPAARNRTLAERLLGWQEPGPMLDDLRAWLDDAPTRTQCVSFGVFTPRWWEDLAARPASVTRMKGELTITVGPFFLTFGG